METKQSGCSCGCGGGPQLIFACSGAADVGELADQTARRLNRDGLGKMFCLAGIGGKVSGIVKTTEAAKSILAIDGCALECARKSLETAGFSKFNHLLLSDHGFEKGSCEVTAETIENATELARKFL